MTEVADEPEGWLDALERAGLQLEENQTEGALVIGNTYAHKDLLKRAGGRWSASRQGWVFLERAHLRAVAGGLTGSGAASAPGGLADAPAGYVADDRSQTRRQKKRYHGHRERLRTRFLEAGSDSLPDYELLELLLFFAIEVRDTKDLAKDLLAAFGCLGGVLAADEARVQEVMAGLNGLERASDAYQDWLRYWRSPQFASDTEALAEGRPLDAPAAALREYPGSEDWRREADRYWGFRFTSILLKVVREMALRVHREEIQDRPVIGSWTALIDYLKVALAHEPVEQSRVMFLDRKNVLIRDEVQQRGTVDHTPLYPREIVKRALELQASALIMVHNHPSGDPTPSRADVQMTKQVVAALEPVGITLHDHVIVGKNRHTSFKTQGLI